MPNRARAGYKCVSALEGPGSAACRLFGVFQHPPQRSTFRGDHACLVHLISIHTLLAHAHTDAAMSHICSAMSLGQETTRRTLHDRTNVCTLHAGTILSFCYVLRRAQPRLISANFVCVILAGSSNCRTKPQVLLVRQCRMLQMRRAQPGFESWRPHPRKPVQPEGLHDDLAATVAPVLPSSPPPLPLLVMLLLIDVSQRAAHDSSSPANAGLRTVCARTVPRPLCSPQHAHTLAPAVSRFSLESLVLSACLCRVCIVVCLCLYVPICRGCHLRSSSLWDT